MHLKDTPQNLWLVKARILGPLPIRFEFEEEYIAIEILQHLFPQPQAFWRLFRHKTNARMGLSVMMIISD